MTPAPPPAVPAAPPAWVGWCRPSVAQRRVWRAVAEAQTERACWEAVYRVMDAQRGGARDWCVLPKGVKP